MKNSIFFLLLVALFSFSISSCSDDDDDGNKDSFSKITTPEEMTAALNEIYNDSEAPGFALSIIKDDEVLYQKAFGKADVEADRLYTNETTQPIGSISKTFVAAAVVKAIEDGHFTMETDINVILPVVLKNPKQPDAVIRVKHLVSHTSGLLDNYEAYSNAYSILPGENMSSEGAIILRDGFGMQQRQNIPLEDFLAEYYLEDGDLYSLANFADTEPGTAWNYSNIATALTAYLVEVATQTPFKEYVQSHIFDPLEMDNTAYDVSQLNPSNIAALHWDRETVFPKYTLDTYPDGGVNTCNNDLSKFMSDMMKGVKGESTTLFSKEGYALLFNEILPNGLLPSVLGENQGVFWFLNSGNIVHDGGDPGTTTHLQFDEMGKTGFLFLSNMDASTDEHEASYFQMFNKVSNSIEEFISNQ